MGARIRVTKEQGKLFEKAGKIVHRLHAPKPKVRREDLPENQVTKTCLDWLRVKGWICIRMQSGLFTRPGAERVKGAIIRVGEKGRADWHAYRPIAVGGNRIDARKSAPLFQVSELEFKAPGKIPKPEQRKWLRIRRETGTPADWFDSFEKFRAWYERMGFDAWV